VSVDVIAIQEADLLVKLRFPMPAEILTMEKNKFSIAQPEFE
jgi:hypothetical protein